MNSTDAALLRALAPRSSRMVVAREDFNVTLDGEVEDYRAGVTYVVADHEVVRRYPKRFAAESQAAAIRRKADRDTPKRDARQRSAPPAATPSKPRPSWFLTPEPRGRGLGFIPELRAGRATKSIVLPDKVRSQIADLAWVARDGAEYGGGLFGHPARGDGWKPMTIVRAMGDVAPTRAAHWMRRDIACRAREAIDSSLAEVGDWHAHPATVGDGIPSEADRAAWWSDAETFARGYLGIIVTGQPVDYGDGISFAKPNLTGWLTHRDRDGVAITERVALK